jgi:hypothetical protein
MALLRGIHEKRTITTSTILQRPESQYRGGKLSPIESWKILHTQHALLLYSWLRGKQ